MYTWRNKFTFHYLFPYHFNEILQKFLLYWFLLVAIDWTLKTITIQLHKILVINMVYWFLYILYLVILYTEDKFMKPQFIFPICKKKFSEHSELQDKICKMITIKQFANISPGFDVQHRPFFEDWISIDLQFGL